MRRNKKLVVLGGGTAGWMTAAAFSHLLSPLGIEICLIESEAIGTIGVGEATLPHLRHFNESLGIDEFEFINETNATIKLGIQFRDWARIGDSYIHPFGEFGRPADSLPFHHLWLRLHQAGKALHPDRYSLPCQMSLQGKFAPPSKDPNTVMSSFSYAYQLDATLYAAYLRRFAEKRGVVRHEGRIVDVSLNGEDGTVDHVILEDGRTIGGDLFIDCTGFRALVIGQALKAEFDDWSDILPCDRAVAVPSDSNGPPLPFTRATARSAGWHWRIPLQHRTGNGHVYASAFLSDDEAAKDLLDHLDAPAQRDPLFLKFKAGMRRQQWIGNCIAVGLSGGFLEPLESTSIYLIQAAITNIAALFPAAELTSADRDEFNRVMSLEYERVRDFLVLHYHATERDDTPFWNYVRTMTIPQSLQEKMALFRERGHIIEYKDGLFLHPSWVAVYLGQRIVPSRYHPLAENLDMPRVERYLEELDTLIAQTCEALPPHAAYLNSQPRQAQS